MELASWLANMQRFNNACLWCNIDGESEFIEDWDIPICKDCCEAKATVNLRQKHGYAMLAIRV